MDRRLRVLIVGGGFAGLAVARQLKDASFRVTLIDRCNHHVFQPLLYQVATAALSPADIASPIRSILRRHQNVEVLMGEVVALLPGEKTVALADGTRHHYDYLVLATGAVDQYFGNPHWRGVAPGLKSIDDAVEIRRRFLLAFEAAEREPDPRVRRELLTTVVIGAGPTGVEMAGAMAEMARHSLILDFRNIDPATARIILIEGGDRVLPGYAPKLSRRAEAALRRRGVDVRKGCIVTNIEPAAVHVGNERIPTRNVVWAAGVSASPLGRRLGTPVDGIGRVEVESDLSVPGHPEIFVVGDLSLVRNARGEPLPGLAPVAIQQGRATGRNLSRLARGEVTEPFHYRDRGSMATIGRGAAIVQFGRIRLWGVIAWLAWIFAHVFFLIGFRNRVAVMLEWGWAYLTWQRGARLITGPVGDRVPRGHGIGHPGTGASPEGEDAVETTPAASAELRGPEVDRDRMSGDPDRVQVW